MAAMEFPVMQPHLQPNLAVTSRQPVHQRDGRFLRAGFTAQESAALMALAVGITRHAEGESQASSSWSWQELGHIEFIGYLARSGLLGGPDDGRRLEIGDCRR